MVLVSYALLKNGICEKAKTVWVTVVICLIHFERGQCERPSLPMSTVTVSHKYNETFRIIAANQRRSIFPCENQYIWRKAESAFFIIAAVCWLVGALALNRSWEQGKISHKNLMIVSLSILISAKYIWPTSVRWPRKATGSSKPFSSCYFESRDYMEIANETLPKSIEAKEFSALFCRDRHASGTVSYTHLTLPTNREV